LKYSVTYQELSARSVNRANPLRLTAPAVKTRPPNDSAKQTLLRQRCRLHGIVCMPFGLIKWTY